MGYQDGIEQYDPDSEKIPLEKIHKRLSKVVKNYTITMDEFRKVIKGYQKAAKKIEFFSTEFSELEDKIFDLQEGYCIMAY
jgi:hypothetical protein